ncbi:alpha/beta hydrolase [Tenacibaculum sp. IB213877]|uniref:alpha/beta hydrolase n=1 Tax=Tenacibaculum sp. IB213877 TaxID=3097351 RepID=UPI002A5B0324|nr:alpha/beta hydrolase-fold protein [Tenacibaculum sp. IB213877]MDY0779939.1 alpha/beta hydrolase-fold protein [Tenacibaculum sp. IB213877]
MKQIFVIVALIFSALTIAQTTLHKKLNSIEFGKNRDLKIHLPKGYESDTTHKYPVAIVLDSDYLFDLYVGNSKIYAKADLAPKQIVVGLDTDYSINQDVSTVETNGALTTNSSKFYNYIKKEVIPYLDTNYKTSPFLTIVGDGIGANFLLHFLEEPKPIFNGYVAISPEMNEQTARLLGTYNLKRLDDIDNDFYLYMSTNPFESQSSKKLYKQLTEALTNLETEKLHLTFDKFEDAPNKPSAISKAPPRAFAKLFELYSRISKEEYDANIKELDPLDAIKYLENKYIDIEYLYGTNLNVRFEDIYAIESIVIDKMDGDYLRVLGDFVMIKHAESHLGEYYVGKYHELGRNYEQALFYYKEAYGKMELSNPNTEAFYENILRVENAAKTAKLEQDAPIEETPLEQDEEDEEDEE